MKRKVKILIIDDDAIFGRLISEDLADKGYETKACETSAEGLQTYIDWHPDLVLLDQNIPDMSGIEVCKKIKDLSPEAKVIFITAFGSCCSAVEAVKAGAYEYLLKPLDFDQLYLAVRNALELKELKHKEYIRQYQSSQRREPSTDFAGVSPQSQKIQRLVEMAAQSDAPVLITGETGTGKSVVARAIHKLSGLEDNLISINCAAIPESMMEAELFGHEKGAYTGAHKRRQGVFVLASGGTLVLDEIGEMPLSLQSKLLTVLEERQVRPLGGAVKVPFDTRLIAITNQELQRRIESGDFRRDLYYRLAVVTIHIPPLRERPEDIPLLTRELLKEITGGQLTELPPKQLRQLQQYSWPGNTRELRNILERSLILDPTTPRPAKLLEVGASRPSGDNGRPDIDLRPMQLVEKEHILRVLDYFDGDKLKAASQLGISLSTVHRRLNRYRREGLKI
jgi:DNA-binding NtrC family response regulator